MHPDVGLWPINIPASVTSIGNFVFNLCEKLSSINVSSDNSLYSSFNGALFNKEQTTIIAVPQGIVGTYTIPSSITSIGNSAFNGCTKLTTVNIPSSVTSIGTGAFNGCIGLTNVNLPSSVTSIEESTFSFCTGLTSVDVPSSVTTIANSAFNGCTKLAAINVASDNPVYSSNGGVLFDKTQTTILYVPQGITTYTIPASITDIGRQFLGHPNLISINIPSSVTTIQDGTFIECAKLAAINVASDNPVYSSKDGILFDKEQTTILTIPYNITGTCTIPASLTSIKYGLNGYQGLSYINVESGNPVYSSYGGVLFNKEQTTIIAVPRGFVGTYTIPSSVTCIGSGAFSDCTGLTTVNIPSSVTSIEASAFSGCTGLSTLKIPSSVTSIGNYAFSGLSSIVIPASVTTIGNYVFDGSQLVIMGTPSISEFSFISNSKTSVALIADESYRSTLQRNWSGEIHLIDENVVPYVVNIQKKCLGGVKFTVSDISDVLNLGADEYVLQSVWCGGTEVTPDATGVYTKMGLPIGDDANYYIYLTYTKNGVSKYYSTNNFNLLPAYYTTLNMTDPMQTSVSCDIRVFTGDESATLTETGIECNDIRYPLDMAGAETESDSYGYSYVTGKVTIKDLAPNAKHAFQAYAIYNGSTFNYISNQVEAYTLSLLPDITEIQPKPTSVSLQGTYTSIDAHVQEASFTINGETIPCDTNKVTFTGLNPNTKYDITYTLTTEEGKTETFSSSLTTPALELTTQQPNGVSEKCSIVSATTNISDEETNVGFQWRKYDAPESLKSSEGYAAIYDGVLEGYIKNLQPTSYYNVRAFYKADDGTYYYGDWVTFDPSDFSYFEPTVHTYSATDVSYSSARVKGYVLAGTDDITEQGFQYWPTEGDASHVKSVRAMLTAASSDDNIITILASGQVMTALLDGLQPSTTYCCHAFVRTAAGITYGEEQTFTTEADPTGIYGTEEKSAGLTITGYYDLNGQRSDVPVKGVNIVRYADGSTQKVFVK